MKKIFTLSFISFFLGAQAQLPVSQVAEKKRVVIEEYTGKTCQYCPLGHQATAALIEDDPENVFVLNIHTGQYASGTPNYRTDYGADLAAQTGLTGYPTGTVNRNDFGATATAVSVNEFSSKAAQIKTEDAYVNVALNASVNLVTRVLTVDVEAYYTAAAPTSTNFLNVAITQDDIHGPQIVNSQITNVEYDENGDYIHNHMLRHFMTGQWGDTITTVSQGDLIQKTYTYTFPDAIGDVDVDLTKLNIVAFMTETKQDIINGNGAKPALTGLTNNLEAQVMALDAPESSCAASFDPKVSIRNWGNTAITSMKIEYSANDLPAQTYDWTGNLLGGITEDITLPTLSYNSQASNDITVKVVEVNGGNDDVLTNNEVTAVVLAAEEYQTTTMTLTFTSDQYSGVAANGDAWNENSWALFNSSGVIIQEAVQGSISIETPYVVTLNLPTYDCYTFEFYDEYGDGLTGSGPGTVSLDHNGTNVLSGSGSFSKLSVGFATVDASGNGNGNPTNNVDTTTIGIIDVDLVADFTVFPNPATDLVKVSMETNNNVAVQVELLDVLGRNVMSSNLDNGLATFNVSKLNKGVYIVKASANGQAIATTSLVVR